MFRGSAFLLAACALAAVAADDEPPITSARELRLTPSEIAAERRPVRIEATVIAVDPKTTVFVQDGTGGTYLNNPPGGIRWARGMRLRVVGKTYPGLYVTGVRPDSVEVIGNGPLPEPSRVSAADLASGRWHYQYVEIEGTVRAIEPADDGSTLRLASGSQEIEVRVGEPPTDRPLVGARVTVRGLAAGAINDRRQLVRPFVKATGFADIAVLVPPEADPFEQPSVPVLHLMRFHPDPPAHARVKVTGTVTAHRPGAGLFLRDGADALFVESTQADPLMPGDVVEVVGFPRMGTFRAALADAEFRKVGSEPPPEPVPASLDDILTGALEADLVTLEAELVEGYPTPDGDLLTLRSGDVRFRARCPSGTAESLDVGSRLAVTGTCRAAEFKEGGYRLTPIAFELWPRSPGDVLVLSRSPAWTVRRLLIALGVAAVLAVVAFAWAAALRRQVRRQTAVIREQSAREAVLDERQRIAREVHDSLEQELVGLSLRLEATAVAVPAGKLATALVTARRLVGRIHDEVRSLVWDLRDEVPNGLPEAIRAMVSHLDGTNTSLSVEVDGEPWTVPAVLAHNIKRVVQEAVTNALKHANANRIAIGLRFEPTRLAVSVTDDGCGFAEGSEAKPGHFGLIGIRERVRKLGGDLTVASEPGRGTALNLTVPRPEGSA